MLHMRVLCGERAIEIEAIIDTGFNGALSLPQDSIDFLGALPRQLIESRLADGQIVLLPTFQVEAQWGEELIEVEATITAGQPLIGTVLLQNHEIRIEVHDGGIVEITPLRN